MHIYRKKHPSPGNYAQVAIRQSYDDGTFSKWDISDVYEGFDDIDGENSTHSEQYAHKWTLDTLSIYQKRANWVRVKSLTVVFYSQVQVCKGCRIDMRSWLNAYQKNAGKPVALSIWEHTHFFIKTPSTGAVSSEDDVVQVNIKWDPTPTTSELEVEQAFL